MYSQLPIKVRKAKLQAAHLQQTIVIQIQNQADVVGSFDS